MNFTKSVIIPLTLSTSLPLFAAVAPASWDTGTTNLINRYCNNDKLAVLAVDSYCKKTNCTSKTLTEIKNYCAGIDAQDGVIAKAPTPEPQPEQRPVESKPESQPQQKEQVAEKNSGSLIQLVAQYCYGNAAATQTLKGYCREGKCTSKALSDVKKYCASKGITVDPGELLADTAPAKAPPPVVAETPAKVETPASAPPPAREPEPAQPKQYANLTDLLGDYCRGNSAAESALVQHCSSKGCTAKQIDDIANFCSSIGRSRSNEALIAASDLKQPANSGQNSGQQETPANSGSKPAATQSMVVSWQSPTERVDGQVLGASELAGYEIYITSDTTGDGQTISVKSGNAKQHVIKNLAPDTYHVALVAIDEEGIYSDLSDIVSTTLEGSDA